VVDGLGFVDDMGVAGGGDVIAIGIGGILSGLLISGSGQGLIRGARGVEVRPQASRVVVVLSIV
jgi:hypothetical protein